MLIYVTTLSLLIVIFLTKKLLQSKKKGNTNSENIIEEPKIIKEPINLFSTLDKTKIQKQKTNPESSFYLIKETIVSSDGLTTFYEKEYVFKSNSLYNDKVEARLFLDRKTAEISKKSTSIKLENKQTKLELYLIRNSDFIQSQIHLLIDSNGVENIENRKLESFLFSSMGSNKKTNTSSTNNCISTKNSFLDGDYKD